MSSCQEKIQNARKVLFNHLYKLIIDSSIDLIDCTLKLIFRNGIVLYITYNNHEEYSYQLMYTKDKFDRERFDNYDKNWNVDTKPHHFHVRGENKVINSLMNGNLNDDLPKLLEFLEERLSV